MNRTSLRVLVLTCALAVGALALMPLATPLVERAALPVTLPWWSLAPVYLLVMLTPILYEVRGEVRSFSLTQLAVATGLVFLNPWQHLAARIIGAAAYAVPVRRQPPSKAASNVAMAALEVATASAAAAAFAPATGPGPRLWVALLVALLVAEVTGFLVMQVLFGIIGVHQTREAVRNGGLSVLAGTGVFTGVAIVVVAAAWTDLWTAAVGGVVGLALALGYRQHRRLAADQQQNAELHQFIKGLGPLDLDSADSQDVLNRARLLLHAEHLDLALQAPTGWKRYGDSQHEAAVILIGDDSELDLTHRTRAALLEDNDHMSAPLVVSQEILGVLTVSARMGNARPFGLKDLRLLETLATELAAALERGRLQRDLALAATTDALTRLPNLNEITHRLNTMLASEREGVLVATCSVDSFREVNDTLGHQVGDDLLREVTRRLLLSYPDALIGRIGGGRFAVAVPAAPLGGDPSMFGLGLRAQTPETKTAPRGSRFREMVEPNGIEPSTS